jgi:polyisoprenyl-phosphate glycosyltransferase
MSASDECLAPKPTPRLISIVVPFHNETESVPLLRDQLEMLLPKLPSSAEMIFVDDGSTDGTLRQLRNWAEEDRRITVIVLSRNFGHQVAATAGLDAAAGEAIVLMDADLQDPPEVILEMLREYERGYDVVYAQRKARLGEGPLKRFTAWLFYRLMRIFVLNTLPADTGDYRMVSRPCLEALCAMREQHRFLRGMVAWVGFPQAIVQFVRRPRIAGTTKYPFPKMLRLAWRAAISFSPSPLRVVFGMSLLVALLGMLAAIYAVGARVFGYYVVSGWTSIMATLCLIGCFILFGLGVMGEYVAKIYEEGKGRPLYVIDPSRSVLRPKAAPAAKASDSSQP